jgi:hypothetical protein
MQLMGFLILFTGVFYIALSDRMRLNKKIKPKTHRIFISLGWVIWSAGAVFCLFNYKLTHALMFIVGSLVAKEIIGSLKD